jgi:hypothetical protein
MAVTAGGTPYVESSDLVASYPATSLALANKVDTKLDNAPTDNAQSGTTYTFVLGDARNITTATNASAKTFTIPPQSSVTWLTGTMIRVVNYGAGALTVNGGVGVTVTNTAATLAQYEAATAIRTGSNAWTLVPFSGGSSTPGSLNYLAIAGGGGGGNGISATTNGGAGGAGGYRNSVVGETSGGGGAAENPMPISAGITYTVTIGAGGPNNTSGSDTTITGTGLTTITCTGGGRGGSSLGQAGFTGGSGGGGTTGSGTTPAGGAATANPVQGFNGGAGSNGGNGGGGGGAGGAGVAAPTATGGAGLSSSITGTSVARGGGGGGGGTGSPTASAGGGAGGTSANGGNGTANTGGGGGGGSGVAPGYNGGTGGSGVVILRHPDTFRAATTLTGGTLTTTGGFRIYTFNSTGTIGWS